MNAALDRIETKLEKMGERVEERLDAIDRTLARNAADIEYHIKRTDLLEAQVAKIAAEVKPLSLHVHIVGLLGRGLGIGLGGGAIWKLATWLISLGVK